MRRLFGADSLRSHNQFSLGTSPPCGDGFVAAPLRRRLASLAQCPQFSRTDALKRCMRHSSRIRTLEMTEGLHQHVTRRAWIGH
jgi:hypothetical protein